MQTLWQDLRYALRAYKQNPVFALIAVLTLALGIGATTTQFSAADATLIKPFDFPQQDRLVVLFEQMQSMGIARGSVSPGNVLEWRAQSQTLQEVIVMRNRDFVLTGDGAPERYTAYTVSAAFFEALGVKPQLGRTFQRGEDEAGHEQVVVLRHTFWQQRFGGNPQIVGQQILLDDKPFTIIGVMPKAFDFPYGGGEMWTPFVFEPAIRQEHRNHYLRVLGLLKPGATVAQANADLNQIAQRIQRQFPEGEAGHQVLAVSLNEEYTRGAQLYVPISIGSGLFVLLIACSNVANLLLVRAAARQKEIAVRLALGASRWRLLRQLLTESALLACLGGAAGLLLAWWGVEALVALKPENLPRLESISLDGRVFGFALAVSLLTGLVFGLAPAWLATRLNVSAALKEGGRGAVSGARHRLRSALVVAELALALILLVGAGLLIKSFWQLRTIQPGFNPNNLLTLRLELPEARYKEIEKQTQFRRALLDSLNAVPGVQAALVSEVPLGGDWLSHDFTREGWQLKQGDEPEVWTRSIEGEYLRTMQIPLLSGRDFTAQDKEGAPLVGIVNQTLVSRYFPNEDPIGKRVRWARDEQVNWITIVGVAGDIKHFGLDIPEEPALYTPYPQSGRAWKRWMGLTVRTQGEPARFADAVKQAVWKLDAQLPLTKVRSMSEVLALSMDERRFNLLLLAVFAAVALALAASGIYGVISYAVTQRTHEIGVRMALGARTQDVLALIVKQGAKLALLGTALGLVGAIVLTRWLKTLLFGVSVTDPLTFAVIAVLLLSVALLASYLPARRAAKVDPLVALRYE